MVTPRILSLFGKLLLLFSMMLSLPAAFASPTRIACVGDSITYGYGISKRGLNSYPAQLQQRLEEAEPGRWEVRNFGVSAMTLMKGTSRPYMGRAEYRASVDYAADVVIIMLGTNDTNGMFRHMIEANFRKDYQELIASYRRGREAGTPRIILMLPPKCYLAGDGLYDPSEPIIHRTILPMVRELAQAEKLELIDLSDALGLEWDAALMPDKLHPSAAGATRMVERIAPALLNHDTATHP